MKNPETAIVNLLAHRDPTSLQLAAPILMLEEWENTKLISELEKKEKEIENAGLKEVKLNARAHALFSVSKLLLDIAPTWGLWDRNVKKRKLTEILEITNKKDHDMSNDEWQNPYADLPGEEDEDIYGSSYTDIFYKTTNWRTVWPLCDFLREIEVHKNHKFY